MKYHISTHCAVCHLSHLIIRDIRLSLHDQCWSGICGEAPAVVLGLINTITLCSVMRASQLLRDCLGEAELGSDAVWRQLTPSLPLTSHHLQPSNPFLPNPKILSYTAMDHLQTTMLMLSYLVLFHIKFPLVSVTNPSTLRYYTTQNR